MFQLECSSLSNLNTALAGLEAAPTKRGRRYGTPMCTTGEKGGIGNVETFLVEFFVHTYHNF